MNEMTQSTITPAQLKQLMAEHDDVRILDVRTGGEFESVHISGSYNVPLDTFGEHAGELAAIEEPVVLICQSGARADKACQRLTSAGKTTLTVLDGGIQAWCALGNDLEHGAPLDKEFGDFSAAAVKDHWIVETDELIRLLAQGEAALLDARAKPRFEGLVEPIDPVAGHVPGALNLPFNDLLSEDATFLDPAALEARFSHVLGSASAKGAITMCGSGVTACHLQLGLEAAGLGMGRLYVGSWSEWIRDPQRPVAKV